MGQAGGLGVIGAADETLGSGPVGWLGAAEAAKGKGAALGELLGGGVDGELGCAVVVGEGDGDAAIVLLDGLVAPAEVEVARGFRRGGTLGQSDFGGAQVEGGLGRCPSDEAVALGVVEVFGDLVAASSTGSVTLARCPSASQVSLWVSPPSVRVSVLPASS